MKKEINYPLVLPAGTIIQINQRPDNKIKLSAVGLCFQLSQDVTRVGLTIASYRTGKCEVVKDPNGWNRKTVSHTTDLRYDEIVYIQNRKVKNILENFKE